MVDGMPLITFQDEFGGYSSRLRTSSKKQIKEEADQNGLEVNLCQLLGLDIEAIAKRIAMGIEESDEENEDPHEDNFHSSSDLNNRRTAASMADKSFASPNEKHSMISELLDH